MFLKKDEKYFHLSEIFSYYNGGVQMYLPEEAKMPDGEFRSVKLAFEAAVHVAQHISGRKLVYDNDRQMDFWAFMNICDDVDQALEKQLPWLKDIDFPQEEFSHDTHEAIKKRRDWVRKKALELGSEWFVLKTDKDRDYHRIESQPPNGLPLRPKKS